MVKGKRSGFARWVPQDEEQRIKAAVSCFKANGLSLSNRAEKKFVEGLERYLWDRHFESDRPNLGEIKKQTKRVHKAAVEFYEALNGIDRWTLSIIKKLQVVVPERSPLDHEAERIVSDIANRGGFNKTEVLNYLGPEIYEQLREKWADLIKKDGAVNLKAEAAARKEEILNYLSPELYEQVRTNYKKWHKKEVDPVSLLLGMLLEAHPQEGKPRQRWSDEDYEIISHLKGKRHADLWATASSLALNCLPVPKKGKKRRSFEHELIIYIAEAWYSSTGKEPGVSKSNPQGPFYSLCKDIFTALNVRIHSEDALAQSISRTLRNLKK